MRVTFDMSEPGGRWGRRQPKFERLACDGPGRFFLIYRDESGERIRVQLAPARHYGQAGK